MSTPEAYLPAETSNNNNFSLMPVMDINAAIERRNQMVKFVQAIMVDGVDFGTVPGTGSKPTLLKPGAEKLGSLFGLSPRFNLQSEEDWTGEHHGGEPFFNYVATCQLWRGNVFIAEGIGNASSHESKYRYRRQDRKCPECGAETIRKSKEEWGGGWYCKAADGGCGKKFDKDDKRISEQETGRKLNPDVADCVNTLMKMAQKRALVAAILIATNASEFFTQDVEDMTDVPVEGGAAAPKADNKQQGTNGKAKDESPEALARNRCRELYRQLNEKTGYTSEDFIKEYQQIAPDFKKFNLQQAELLESRLYDMLHPKKDDDPGKSQAASETSSTPGTSSTQTTETPSSESTQESSQQSTDGSGDSDDLPTYNDPFQDGDEQESESPYDPFESPAEEIGLNPLPELETPATKEECVARVKACLEKIGIANAAAQSSWFGVNGFANKPATAHSKNDLVRALALAKFEAAQMGLEV